MILDPPCTCGHPRESHGNNERGYSACNDCECSHYEADSSFAEFAMPVGFEEMC